MADNNVQIELELLTKAFVTALQEADRLTQNFGKTFDGVEKDASKSLENVGKAGKDAGKDIADGGKEASGAWEVFKGVLGAEAFISAFNFVKDAAVGLFNTFVVDGVAGAREAEASLIKLKATLANTGDQANGTLEDFQAFAAQMQANTKADGDAVLGQLALAKQYGLTNAQAKQVVQTATDMAARGYDADTSVKQLAESFSGQAGRLAKLNPALRELTEEQLKAGAAADLLAAQFEGSAAKAVETFDGKLAQAQNAFGDLQEEIGFLITQNPALTDALGLAVSYFQELTQYIGQNKEEIKAFVGDAVTLLVEAFIMAVEAGKAFFEFISENKTEIEAVAVGIGAMTVALGLYALAVNAAAIATGIGTVAQIALNVAMTANPVGLIIVAIGALAAGVYYAAENWDLITAAIAGFTASALTLLIPVIQYILASLKPIISLFDEELAESLDGATALIQEKVAELEAFQAEKEAEAAVRKQASRDGEKAADDQAHQNKLNGLAATNAAEMAMQQTQTKTKQEEKKAALLEEAAEQKAANKAAIEEKKAKDAEIKEADKKFEQELAKERREARANHEKFQAEYEKQRRDKEDQEKELAIRREISLTDAIKSELGERQRFEEETSRNKVANFRSTLGEISTLQRSSSKELFAIGKAAAIADATIHTYQAATVALSSAPPPYNYVLAALVTAAGLENVRQIASSSGNFANGGVVPGTSYTGDKLTANVNSREAIFNVQQQKKLFELANGGGDGGGNSALIVERLDRLERAIMGQPLVVEIDGEVIANAVRTQVRGGFSLGGT